MTALGRRYVELLREAVEPAAREACSREQRRLWDAMDEEDRAELAPFFATLHTLTVGPETPDGVRAVVAWLNATLAAHGAPLH